VTREFRVAGSVARLAGTEGDRIDKLWNRQLIEV